MGYKNAHSLLLFLMPLMPQQLVEQSQPLVDIKFTPLLLLELALLRLLQQVGLLTGQFFLFQLSI
jgi:hypothetical protein